LRDEAGQVHRYTGTQQRTFLSALMELLEANEAHDRKAQAAAFVKILALSLQE
jgi:hypothetical protein